MLPESAHLPVVPAADVLRSAVAKIRSANKAGARELLKSACKADPAMAWRPARGAERRLGRTRAAMPAV